MDNHLNRHTYGFIQSRLVPFYLHLGSACAFLNLTIYAVYHPRDMLNEKEAFQVGAGSVLSAASLRAQSGRRTDSVIFLPSPPDLHLLCVGDGRGGQRPVVRPDGVGDHGRHASRRAGVRTGPGHRPVVEPRGLRQAVRDGREVQTPERPPVALPAAVVPVQPLLHRLQLLQSVLHGREPGHALGRTRGLFRHHSLTDQDFSV